MRKFILIILSTLFATAVFSQPAEMATKLRSEGKIYVVVGVMLIIFLGVAIYLFTLDRRIKKIEDSSK